MAASKPHLRHVRNRAVSFALGDCKTFMESIPSCTRLKSRGISTTEIEIPSSQALFVQAKAPRMGTLSIPKILVQDSSLGVSVVAVEMILVEGKTKKVSAFNQDFELLFLHLSFKRSHGELMHVFRLSVLISILLSIIV